MGFIDQGLATTDPETNSKLKIVPSSQIEFKGAEFSSPLVSLRIQLEICLKFPDRPILKDQPINPGIQISAGYLDWRLRGQNMNDVESNSTLVLRIVRMIAFVNKRHPLARSPFLWSDYQTYAAIEGNHPVYRMPSDEELIRISIYPE